MNPNSLQCNRSNWWNFEVLTNFDGHMLLWLLNLLKRWEVTYWRNENIREIKEIIYRNHTTQKNLKENEVMSVFEIIIEILKHKTNPFLKYLTISFFLSTACYYDIIVITSSQIVNSLYQILLMHAYILLPWSLLGVIFQLQRKAYLRPSVLLRKCGKQGFCRKFKKKKNLSWFYAVLLLFLYNSTSKSKNPILKKIITKSFLSLLG